MWVYGTSNVFFFVMHHYTAVNLSVREAVCFGHQADPAITTAACRELHIALLRHTEMRRKKTHQITLSSLQFFDHIYMHWWQSIWF